MAKSEPVGLGIGKFKLRNSHPFFIASIYHDAAWEAVAIYQGKQTWQGIADSIVINNDPRYYYDVVTYQHQHLLKFVSKIPSLRSYIKYHDDNFLDICLKLAKAQKIKTDDSKKYRFLKSQAYLFYALVTAYRLYKFK